MAGRPSAAIARVLFESDPSSELRALPPSRSDRSGITIDQPIAQVVWPRIPCRIYGFGVASTRSSLESCGRPHRESCRWAAHLSPALCGRSRCGGLRSEWISTTSSPESCGWPSSLKVLDFGNGFNQPIDVRPEFQPAHPRSCVVSLPAVSLVWGQVQPAHHRS